MLCNAWTEYSGSGPPLRLRDETITASDHVRLLGVTISSDLSPVKHVGTISLSHFYWLRQIRRIRRSLDAESAKTLVHAFITSRIDGCNTVLPGRQEPSLTGYNICWMPHPILSVILGSSTEAWHICSTPSCTGSMFRSKSSISSKYQFTGVSNAGLPSTSWTAATPHRTLPVIIDFDLPAATILFYHNIVVARSAIGRSPSLVWWPGMHCLTTSETRRSVPTISGRR